MSELAICGGLLLLISVGMLAAGIASGEMPFNHSALDTTRETNPAAFWGLAGSFAVFAVLGIAIVIRHWSG